MQTVDRLLTNFVPEHYKLSLILARTDRAFEGTALIRGTVSAASRVFRLHGKDLIVTNALINDNEANIEINTPHDEIILTMDSELQGDLTIELQFSGKITDPMHGLYPCYYEHGGVKKELLATQFESHHAREVFPCIDEPEAKATFDLTLFTEKGVTVLGNMPVSAQSEEEDWLVTTFETSPRMSSYLLAFIVGELQCKTAKTTNGTEVSVWATPAQKSESLDFALDSAVRTIEFFNEYFGVPYPLPKSDHVALPDFSSGAMENWGLITYREVVFLVDPQTTSVSIREYAASVIAHELSHQWFGNLVTMKWWDDLWLNESFATLMSFVAVDAIYPEWNTWDTFVPDEGLPALRRDSIPGVQPVKVDVHHPDEIGTLFDGAIVYAKGARLLYMLYNYIGEEAFRQGLSNYFETHKYGNTIGTDLWNSLSSVSDKNVGEFMDQWLLQPGFPLVRVSQQGSELKISQQKFSISSVTSDEDVIWPVPLRPSTDDPSIPELLDSNEGIYQLASDEYIRLNNGGIGHFTVRYISESHREAIKQSVASGKIGTAERLLLLNDGAMQARAGIGSITEVLQLLNAYANETAEPVWDMISLIIADSRRLIEGDEEAEAQLKHFVRQLIDSEYQRLGWDEIAEESNSDIKLRSLILGLAIYSEDPEIITEAKRRFAEANSIEQLPAEIRGVILSAVIRHDDSGTFDDLLKRHNETHNAELKQELAGALTSTKDTVRVKQLLSLITDPEIVRLQDVDHWFVWLIRNRYARKDTWQWMVSNWQWIEKNFRNDKSYENFPRYAATAFSNDEWFERYKAFFAPLAAHPALKRTIAMGLTDIASRAEWQRRDGSLVKQYLSQL